MEKLDKQVLLLNYLLNEVTAAEKAVIEKELREDPDLQRELFELRSLVHLTKTALGKELLPKISGPVMSRLESEMRSKHLWTRPQFLGAIAAACLVVLVGVIFKGIRSTQKPEAITVGEQAPESLTNQWAAEEPQGDQRQVGEGAVSEMVKGKTFLISGSTEDFGDLAAIEALKDPSFARQAGEQFADDPKRMAMAVGFNQEASQTVNGSPTQMTMAVLAAKEQTFIDCFKEGYNDRSYLNVRIFINETGSTTKVETIKAHKMPLENRLCVSEIIENTVFTGVGGFTFTLMIRPMSNFK